MSKPKQEVDVDLDFDDINEDEVETKTEESEVSMSKVDQQIEELIAKSKAQSTAYVDQRLAQVDDKLKKQAQTLEKHSERLDTIDSVLTSHTEILKQIHLAQKASSQGASMPNPDTDPVLQAQQKQTAQAQSHPAGMNIIDTTLGTVGGVLHGVVDTTAFILESAVDLVTLGRARKAPHQ